MDKGFLRSFILSVVKPLKSGKFVTQSKDQATIDNLYPDGGQSDNFRLPSPFGFIANVPKGVTAFYQSLFGSGHETIILAQLHKGRPDPGSMGSILIYATDSTGTSLKATIAVTNDGKLSINAPGDVTVTSATKAVISAPAVEVGAGSLEKVLNGETFQMTYNQHYHIDAFGLPTDVPTTPSSSSDLSAKVKAAK